MSLLSVVGLNELFAQPNLPPHIADSLWNVWTNPEMPDRERANAIHDYAWKGYLRTKPDSAFYFANLMFEFTKSVGLKDMEAVSITMMGNTWFMRGNYDEALIYAKKSLQLYEEIESKRQIGLALGNIGNLYAGKGEYALGLEYYNRAKNIFQELEFLVGIAQIYNNIGLIYYYQKNNNEAIDYFTKSLELKEKFGDKRSIAHTLGNFGITYANMREFEKAIEYNEKCLEIQLQLNDKFGVANSYDNIGMVYGLLEKYEEAEVYFLKGKELRESVGDKRGIVQSLNNIAANFVKTNDFEKMMEIATEGYSLAKEVGIPKMIKEAAKYKYMYYVVDGSLNNAYEILNEIRDISEFEVKANYFSLTEREKELYFKEIEADFAVYFEFVASYNDVFPKAIETAYNIALTNKGLLLKSSTAMRQNIINSGDSLLIKEYEEWLEMKKNIAKMFEMGQDTKELESLANSYERELVKKSSLFSDFEKFRNVRWENVKAGLKKGEAAVEFVHYKSLADSTDNVYYLAFIITHKSKKPILVKLCSENELEDILGRIQGNDLEFVKAVYGDRENSSSELYEKIWKPLEKHLKGVKKVYYSPSGLLHKVSFAALGKGKNVYLSDNYMLLQMSSTANVALKSDLKLDNNDSYLILGGVQYNTENTGREVWNYLPGTEKEAIAIKSKLNNNGLSVNYLFAENANEENLKLKAENYSVLHISTHGFFFPDPEKAEVERAKSVTKGEVEFRGVDLTQINYANWSFVNNKNPLMRSGLVLAGGNDVWERRTEAEGEDGILTANEVSVLNLPKTKLVVLSACETGLGDIKGSEGVYGLQRAFKIAGVQNIIMSLWQVPDKETVEFMELFYDNLIKSGNVNSAFLSAQEHMRIKYDPFFWAAFVLIE